MGSAAFRGPTKAAPTGEIIVTLKVFKNGVEVGAITQGADPKKLAVMEKQVAAWVEQRARSAAAPMSS